ncbi:MAG: hypothetical protein FJZ11_03805, partial [Candidatus Omnitrophica bacterium]|nr:hypothetical protein [Candidatus Omnitrophota bacterium]
MKRIASFVLVGLLLACVSCLVFAEEQSAIASKETQGSMMGPEGLMMPQQGQKEMPMMHQMMMKKKMMDNSMVATTDGGVVVMVGNKLYKYDKNLNLIKETEIKMECPMMQEKMLHMEKDRSRSQKMLEER